MRVTLQHQFLRQRTVYGVLLSPIRTYMTQNTTPDKNIPPNTIPNITQNTPPNNNTSAIGVESVKKSIYDTAGYAVESLNDSRMVKDLKDLYLEMENRKYNMRWIGLTIAGVVLYIFYGKITDWASDQAADVTSKYLDNPKFKRDIVVFVEQTIDDLVKSERVQNDITKLLKDAVVKLSDDEDVQNKLRDLFVKIFKSQAIKEAGSELSEDVLEQLLHSPKYEKIRRQAMDYVVYELRNIVDNKDLQQSVGIASWNAFKVWFGMAPNKIEKVDLPVILQNETSASGSKQ